MADHVCDLPVRERGSRFNSKPLAWGESIAIFCLVHARGRIFEKWDTLLSSPLIPPYPPPVSPSLSFLKSSSKTLEKMPTIQIH